MAGSKYQETASVTLNSLLFITIYDESSLSVNFEQLFVQVSVPTNMVQIKFKRGQSSKALSPWRNKITEVEFTARRNKKVRLVFWNLLLKEKSKFQWTEMQTIIKIIWGTL